MTTYNEDKLGDMESGLIQVAEVADAVMEQRPVLTISLAPTDCGPPMLLMSDAIARSSERDDLITRAITRLQSELKRPEDARYSR